MNMSIQTTRYLIANYKNDVTTWQIIKYKIQKRKKKESRDNAIFTFTHQPKEIYIMKRKLHW